MIIRLLAQRIFLDISDEPQQILDEFSPPERNGKEGNGENINKSKVEPIPINITQSITDATLLFENWQSTMNHPGAKFDRKRKQIITIALKLGYSINDLKQAIDGFKNKLYNQ